MGFLTERGGIGPGQCFVSPNGRFEWLLQSDGNFVLYDRSVTPMQAMWSTGTGLAPLSPVVAMRTLYSYDALGNLLCVEQHGDAASGTGCSASPASDATSPWRVRRFSYNSLSQLLTAKNPESGTISYVYDADSELLQKTSPAPNQTGSATQTVSYCYDELHRVKGKGYGAQSCPLATTVVTYAYDSGANAKGKLTSLTDQAGTASYTYDVLERLATETRVLTGANNAAISKSIAYSYNLDSSVKTLTYPSGKVITYTPWHNGTAAVSSPQDAKDLGSGTNYVTGATYGPDGSLNGFISGSGGAAAITNAFSYNKRLQPLGMSATFGSPLQTVFNISYDFHLGNGDNGNVWGITNNKDTTRNQTFAYDSLNRLISARNGGTDCTVKLAGNINKFWGNSYTYDAWGNLIGKALFVDPAGVIPPACAGENLGATVDAHNWIHASGTDYQYDAAGNMTRNVTPTIQNYTYDEENRLTGAAGYTYTYDADGNRVRKSNGNTVVDGTLYWYMTLGVVAETDLAGATKSEYIFFDGERVARRDGATGTGGVFYYFSDHLKTASVITDAAGVIKAESDYYPWGGELKFVDNDSNDYKFTAKKRDTETGLDYFGARYYSNGLGRWVSADWSAKPAPIPYADPTNPQTFNQYTYVHNNPATLADLDGHDDWLDAAKKWFAALIQPVMDAHDSKGSAPVRDTSPYNPITGTTTREVVVDTTDKVSAGIGVVHDVVMLADFTGLGGASEAMMRNDPKGVALSMAFMHIPGGGSITMREAKSLVGGWSKGSFKSVAESIRYHGSEHGAEVGAKNVWQYMRKAAGFKQNLKGATKSSVEGATPGVTRYTKNGKYIDLDKKGSIVSFGKAD